MPFTTWRLIARHLSSTWRYAASGLRGAKPRDLPIEQPTNFELVINRKAAKALNLPIPRSVLLRADSLVE